MAAEYDFRKKPSKGKGDGPDELIPRIVSKGTIRTGDLIKDLSQPTTFQEGELMGALETLVNGVVTYLENGYTVELGNLGFFSLKLKARPVTDKKEIRSPSIVVDKVNFRSSAWLREQFATIKLQRARSGFRSSAEVEKSERWEKLAGYLDCHLFISRPDYSQLTGLLKNKAQADLDDWVEEGLLESRGRGSGKRYFRIPRQHDEVNSTKSVTDAPEM